MSKLFYFKSIYVYVNSANISTKSLKITLSTKLSHHEELERSAKFIGKSVTWHWLSSFHEHHLPENCRHPREPSTWDGKRNVYRFNRISSLTSDVFFRSLVLWYSKSLRWAPHVVIVWTGKTITITAFRTHVDRTFNRVYTRSVKTHGFYNNNIYINILQLKI